MKRILCSTLILTLIPIQVIAAEATYYSGFFEGRPMANGQIYRGSRRTAAHMTYKLGTCVEVINVSNKKKTRVVITDRGNFPHRNIDLSIRAFKDIASLGTGRTKVLIKKIPCKTRG